MSISQKSRGRSPFVEMPSWAVTVSASALSFPSQTSSRSLSKSERRHRHNRLGCLRVAAFASRCLCTRSKARFASCSPRGGRGSQNSPCLNHKHKFLFFLFDFDSKQTRQTTHLHRRCALAASLLAQLGVEKKIIGRIKTR